MRALAAALVLVPLPAVAQGNAMPEWLVGTWCPPGVREPTREPPDPPVTGYIDGKPVTLPAIPRPDYVPYQLGQQCMTWTLEGGRMFAEDRIAFSGIVDTVDHYAIEPGQSGLRFSHTYTSMAVRQGRPVWYELVSQGPAEIVFQTKGRRPQRFRYRREGALLIAETSGARREAPQRWEYRRATAQ
jgi:hypothetical protein